MHFCFPILFEGAKRACYKDRFCVLYEFKPKLTRENGRCRQVQFAIKLDKEIQNKRFVLQLIFCRFHNLTRVISLNIVVQCGQEGVGGALYHYILEYPEITYHQEQNTSSGNLKTLLIRLHNIQFIELLMCLFSKAFKTLLRISSIIQRMRPGQNWEI